jgi:hypothetical protein
MHPFISWRILVVGSLLGLIPQHCTRAFDRYSK